MPRPPLLLGVDVGGTTMAAGVVTPQGEVVLEERVPTYRDGPGSALRTLVELIAKTRAAAEKQGHTISGIGIGVPGPVDVDAGRIGDPVIHVPELAGRPLAGELTERYGVPGANVAKLLIVLREQRRNASGPEIVISAM